MPPNNAKDRLSHVLRSLRGERGRLRERGIPHLSVFGSTAREEAGADSDVDLIVDLEPAGNMDIFDLASIAAELETVLGTRVDLVRRGAMKPHVAQAAAREEVVVF